MKRKGVQIKWVQLHADSRIEAMGTDGNLFKLTRTQRNIFTFFSDKDFLEKVHKDFGDKNILSDDFVIINEHEDILYEL